MTDAEQLQKFLTIYEHVLQAINEGVHVVDRDAVSVVYNRKMTELESMRAADVLGKKLLDVFHFQGGQQSTLLQALETGAITRNVRQTYYNDRGQEITTINNTYPILVAGEIIGAIEIANDVTKMERLIRENILVREKGQSPYTFASIIGSSSALQEVIENAKRAARTSSSVLLVGETGTGKELFVQSIHHASTRAGGPLIAQNCAALPDSLIEGLLFGTTRGAFTGAVERPGLFEQAEGGTLFLDEINSLSLPLQAKLLRALQEKTIRRIGDTRDRTINVRIIAALNEDPVEAIAGERMRKDLYYRLGVVTLFLPPLRERPSDIEALVEHFIQKYNQLFQMAVRGISDEVRHFFHSYDWPGNVRELQHLIEGAMNLMVDEELIQLTHLPIHHARRTSRMHVAVSTSSVADAEQQQEALREASNPLRLREQVEAFEQQCIETCIARHHGNISRAAKELGMSRQSLQYRLRKQTNGKTALSVGKHAATSHTSKHK